MADEKSKKNAEVIASKIENLKASLSKNLSEDQLGKLKVDVDELESALVNAVDWDHDHTNEHHHDHN